MLWCPGAGLCSSCTVVWICWSPFELYLWDVWVLWYVILHYYCYKWSRMYFESILSLLQVILCREFSEKLQQFPLLASWYQRIQEVPKVKTAASKCGIHFLYLPELLNSESRTHLNSTEAAAGEEPNDPSFTGGPRPTMTKLMVFSFSSTVFFLKSSPWAFFPNE